MSKNDITGDRLVSKGYTEEGRANYDRIFCKHDWASDVDPGPDATMTLTCMKCGLTQEERFEESFAHFFGENSEETCGKINCGKPCSLPKGTKCPDCSTALIDFQGDD